MNCSVDICYIHLSLSICYFPYFSVKFCLVDLSVGESGLLLKSLIINVWGLMCDLSFSNVSFTNVGCLVFWGIDVQN